MVGGMFWCIGNLTVVPIIGLLGLGLGILLWSLISMITGWLIGTVGILIPAQHVPTPALNYAGLAVAASSFFIYFFVKTEKKEEAKSTVEESLPLVPDDSDTNSWNAEKQVVAEKPSKLSNPMVRKLLGIVLSIGAGICYGVNMLPVSYLAVKYPEAGPFDFAFSHFGGIFFTSTCVLAFYTIIKCNRPFIEPRSILGGIICGLLWGVAQCAFFAANVNLGLPVSFPIVSTGPGLVANIWGIFFLKEIRGCRNLMFLCIAFGVTVLGIILITLSKVDFGGSAVNATLTHAPRLFL